MITSREFSRMFQNEIKLVLTDYWKTETQVKDMLEARGFSFEMINLLYSRFNNIRMNVDAADKKWWRLADKIPAYSMLEAGDYRQIMLLDGSRITVPSQSLMPVKPSSQTVVERVYDQRKLAWGVRLEEKFNRLGLRNNPRTVRFNNNQRWFCDFSSKTYIDAACLPTRPPEFAGWGGIICLEVECFYDSEEGYEITKGLGIKTPAKNDYINNRAYTYEYYWGSYQGMKVSGDTEKDVISKLNRLVKRSVLKALS